MLGVGSTRGNQYVLGSTFLRCFKTEFNFADNSITLSPNKYAPYSNITAAPIPPINWNPLGIPWYFWLVIGLAAGIIIILMIITCIRCRNRSPNVI